MVVLDANVILRYLLNDNEEMAREAENVIKTEVTVVPIEVIAEVGYVLKGVYSIEKIKIRDALVEFLSEVSIAENEVIQVGLETYAENNLFRAREIISVNSTL